MAHACWLSCTDKAARRSPPLLINNPERQPHGAALSMFVQTGPSAGPNHKQDKAKQFEIFL